MVDPAIDHAGRKLDAFLTNAITELKSREAAPMEENKTQEEPQPVTRIGPGLPAGTLIGEIVQPGNVVVPAKPAAKPAPANKFAALASKVAAGNKGLDAWADGYSKRWDQFEARAEAAKVKADTKLAAKNLGMDVFEASLVDVEAIGNEGNEAGEA